MAMPNQVQRAAFAKELLERLHQAQQTIDALTVELSHSPDDAKAAAQEEDMERIQSRISKYREMVDEVRCHQEAMTGAVSDWLVFIHDPASRRHLLFPLRMMRLRRKTRASIRNHHAEIAAIAIKSRLLQDDISRLEYGIRMETIRRIQSGGSWQRHQQALDEKDELMRRLCYLLPTLSGFEQATLDASSLSDISSRLMMIPSDS